MKRSRHTVIFQALMLTLAFVLLSGCSSDADRISAITDTGDFTAPLLSLEDSGDRGKPSNELPADGKWITPELGGLVKADFFSVIIPPGALSEDTYISVTRDDPYYATVELGPHGIQFNTEVYLRIDLKKFHRYMKKTGTDATDLSVAHFNELLGGWVALETFYAGGEFNLGAIMGSEGNADAVTLPDQVNDEALNGREDFIWAVTTHFSRYALAD